MNINISGPANPLGYGVVGLNVLRQLYSMGHKVSYWPIGNIECEQEDIVAIQEMVNNQDNYDKNGASLKIWHQHDLAQHVGKGKHCGFPIFELDKFTEREVHQLNQQDTVFVCSQWAAGVVAENTKQTNIKVAPLGVDSSTFFSSPINEGPTVFLNVGKWEIRKGHDVLIRAFEQAFREDDNVELWMMNHNPFLSDKDELEWKRLYNSGKLANKINFLERVKSHTEVADIMRKADCGVFPSRAEGWNLEALEMLSCGRQVIVTDYSAHTEFCNNENSHLIKIDELESAFDGIWFKGEGRWAAIGQTQIDQLSEYMRKVHEQKQGGEDILNVCGIDTAKTFNWKSTVDKILEAL